MLQYIPDMQTCSHKLEREVLVYLATLTTCKTVQGTPTCHGNALSPAKKEKYTASVNEKIVTTLYI